MLIRAVVISNDPDWARAMRALLPTKGVSALDSLFDQAAVGRLENLSFDVALIDRAAFAAPLKEALEPLVNHRDRPGVYVFPTTQNDEDTAELIAAGANAVIGAGASPDGLARSLESLIVRREGLIKERLERGESRPDFRLADFASYSAVMTQALELAQRVARSDTSLLITGETGVGKEWMARAIHAASRRSAGPFVAINCAAIPSELLESELFGHEKGAFTGAVREHRGYFELAHGGTLMLDEIGDMSPMLQAKLLRVLQDKAVRRVGAEKTVHYDVRIIAATHRDLSAEIAEENFREDLYYRLAVVTLEVPPLRQRQEDIPHLAKNHLEKLSAEITSTSRDINDDAMRALVNYAWPGNVRELINVMERAVLLCDRTQIGCEDLPATIIGARAAGSEVVAGEYLQVHLPNWKNSPLKEVRQQAIDVIEALYLGEHLRANEGRIAETAAACGIDPRSVYEKLKKLGLDKNDFKPGVEKVGGPGEA